MRLGSRASPAFAALALALAPEPVWAHEPGLSRLTIARDRIELAVHRIDAADPPRLLDGTRASVDGSPCTLGPADVRADDNGFVAAATLSCPLGQRLELVGGWFDQLAAGHRTAALLDGAQVALLDADHPSVDTARVPTRAEVVRGYLGLGIAHILTGWDHLAFLLALLVRAPGPRSIAKVVTAFTVAHSLTLSLAVLGIVAVPSAVVEPAIAATIVLVGLENLARPPEGRRVWTVGGLGLVHGLGFAGLLSELGLPPGAVPLALGAFNVGVELGQLALVAVALPALLRARRSERWERVGVPAVSIALAAAGAAWLVMRIV